MEKVYYSPSTNGFYVQSINGSRIPTDVVEVTPDQYVALMEGQSVGQQIIADAGVPRLTAPASSLDSVLAGYEAAIEARLDQFARSRGYRHGDRLASYKGSQNATWSAEAGRFIELRDQTWAKCYAIIAEVKAGKRSMPTLDELLLELPVLSWDDNV